MYLYEYIIISLLLVNSVGFQVRGPSGPLVVPLGGSVVLPCFINKALLSEGLEVEWRRSDSETLVHLYQDGESRPEVQQQDYHDRAHFFTDQIQHGNFSLLLNNVTAEDEGQYTCKVFSEQDSAETVVEIKHVERLIVSGSEHSISAYAGEDVTMNCSVDSHITPEEIEEVSWKKTDKDGDILVLLYQNNETLPDSSNEKYRDRVEFFTDAISEGNFSLRLKSVRTEDKGVYMCQVFAGGVSANTTVVMELGFSYSHMLVLILCVTASGSALLLCCLIYCRSPYEDTFLHLQMFLIFCPNIIMFLAFVFWGVSEGSVNESIACCVLYFLRPLMLLWATPYVLQLSGKTKTLILDHSHVAEYIFFSVVVYVVLFKSALEKILNYAEFDRAIITVLFGIVLLCPSAKIIYRLIIVAILPVVLMMTNDTWFYKCLILGCSESVQRTLWFIVMLVINAVMMIVFIMTLENEIDPIGWACVIVFLQILWTVIKFTDFTLLIAFRFDRGVSPYHSSSPGLTLHRHSSATLTSPQSSMIHQHDPDSKLMSGNQAAHSRLHIIVPAKTEYSSVYLLRGNPVKQEDVVEIKE
ncbi:uncharacterized protein LOC127632436 [Xyrauchen texanus]|uniref:uncharacterized protein LOC127632436 n=1 Tax=Xyrauchen texanus TaxID=154827 RepID=UPI002242871A|nr:uncharacterized protein LOC127632436 [Xyrauchen texanus]